LDSAASEKPRDHKHRMSPYNANRCRMSNLSDSDLELSTRKLERLPFYSGLGT
jgi:hypothetical protein